MASKNVPLMTEIQTKHFKHVIYGLDLFCKEDEEFLCSIYLLRDERRNDKPYLVYLAYRFMDNPDLQRAFCVKYIKDFEKLRKTLDSMKSHLVDTQNKEVMFSNLKTYLSEQFLVKDIDKTIANIQRYSSSIENDHLKEELWSIVKQMEKDCFQKLRDRKSNLGDYSEFNNTCDCLKKKTLCVVPCSDSKIDYGPISVEKLYATSHSSFPQISRYAKTFHSNSWVILSAKYGFLFPDEIVCGPYNMTFDSDINRQKGLTITVRMLKEQAKRKGLTEYERVLVLTPVRYYKRVEAVFRTLSNSEICYPFPENYFQTDFKYQSKKIANSIKNYVFSEELCPICMAIKKEILKS